MSVVSFGRLEALITLQQSTLYRTPFVFIPVRILNLRELVTYLKWQMTR
jgi:hypothetical protein